MQECSAAASYLHSATGIPGDVRRALETAIPVAYARPWGKSNTIGGLPDHWLPADGAARRLHEQLIDLRNKVYAHTDEEIDARQIEDVSSIAGVPGPYFVPAWHPLNEEVLPAIQQLTESQKARFVAGTHELQRRMRGDA